MMNESERLTINYIKENYEDIDIETREQLIKRYMPLAERIAKRYFDLGIEDEDLLMSAYEGLIIALDSLKDNTPSNFLDYLEHKINTFIKKELMNILGYSTTKRLDGYGINILLQIKKLTIKLGRKPTKEEIPKKSYFHSVIDDIFKIEDMIERLDETFMSYDKLDTTQNASISIEDTVIHEELLNELYNILKLKLNKKEKYVLKYHILYGLPAVVVATNLEVSQPRINQLRSSVIKNLEKII